MMAAPFCMCAKNHWIAHFKWHINYFSINLLEKECFLRSPSRITYNQSYEKAPNNIPSYFIPSVFLLQASCLFLPAMWWNISRGVAANTETRSIQSHKVSLKTLLFRSLTLDFFKADSRITSYPSSFPW